MKMSVSMYYCPNDVIPRWGFVTHGGVDGYGIMIASLFEMCQQQQSRDCFIMTSHCSVTVRTAKSCWSQ